MRHTISLVILLCLWPFWPGNGIHQSRNRGERPYIEENSFARIDISHRTTMSTHRKCYEIVELCLCCWVISQLFCHPASRGNLVHLPRVLPTNCNIPPVYARISSSVYVAQAGASMYHLKKWHAHTKHIEPIRQTARSSTNQSARHEQRNNQNYLASF